MASTTRSFNIDHICQLPLSDAEQYKRITEPVLYTVHYKGLLSTRNPPKIMYSLLFILQFVWFLPPFSFPSLPSDLLRLPKDVFVLHSLRSLFSCTRTSLSVHADILWLETTSGCNAVTCSCMLCTSVLLKWTVEVGKKRTDIDNDTHISGTVAKL